MRIGERRQLVVQVVVVDSPAGARTPTTRLADHLARFGYDEDALVAHLRHTVDLCDGHVETAQIRCERQWDEVLADLVPVFVHRIVVGPDTSQLELRVTLKERGVLDRWIRVENLAVDSIRSQYF